MVMCEREQRTTLITLIGTVSKAIGARMTLESATREDIPVGFGTVFSPGEAVNWAGLGWADLLVGRAE